MNRVIVIGCPGSGKSTFSRALACKTGLPLVYLDRLFWNADKTHVDRELFRQRVSEAIAGEQWIIDGNYSGTLKLRLESCDTVFFLDYDLETCLSGVASRRGKPREDMPWIETEPDAEFLEYIRDFAENQVPEIRALLSGYPQKQIITFHTRRAAEAWLREEGSNL